MKTARRFNHGLLQEQVLRLQYVWW